VAAAVTKINADGKYSFDEESGPVVGRYDVSIELEGKPQKPEAFDEAPANINQRSTRAQLGSRPPLEGVLKKGVVVSPTGTRTIDFEFSP